MSKDLDLHIKGEAVVYRNDKWGYPSYSAKLSSQFNGVWENKIINLGFPKGTEISNKTKVRINDGFFTFYKTKTGENPDKIVITDFEVIEQEVGEVDIPSNTDFNDDLPW